MRENRVSVNPLLTITALLAALSACSVIPEREVVRDTVDVSTIPDAVPRMEPLSETGNPESYEQYGKRYWIIPNPYKFVEKGTASWYGPKFHGKRTSSGDTFDMYKMTAAHKTLPLPSYARVTNLENKRSVVVRINDRGPFKDDRIVDLSYVAAKKLGITDNGTAEVELRVIDPMQYPMAGLPASEGVEVMPLSRNEPLPVEAIPAPEPQVNLAPPAGSVDAGAVATAGVAAAGMEYTDSTVAGVLQDDLAKQIYVQVGAFGDVENAYRLQAELIEIQSHDVIVDPVEGPQGTMHRVQIGPFDSEADALKQEAPLKNHGIDKFQIIRR